MARWRRITGIAGLTAGAAVAAGAGALIAAEKAAVGRLRLRPDPEADEPFGQLRGRDLTVLADDGAALHVEIDGPDDAPVTAIFCHGYALSQDAWHYQRRDLAGAARLVFWDQRGHGRSSEPDADRPSIGRLGADLYTVLTATVPGDRPTVLVGHSMGGMAIMALARQHPELFGTKVLGVLLIATASDSVDPVAWAPAAVRPVVRRAALPALRGVSRGWRASLVEHAREIGSDLAFLSTRYVAFGDRAVSPAVVDFLEQVIRGTPISVVANFYLALSRHDERESLGVLGRVPVTVVAGDSDLLLPVRHGERLAAGIPGSEFVRVPGAGHMVILEQPDLINGLIARLLERVTPGEPDTAARVHPA